MKNINSLLAIALVGCLCATAALADQVGDKAKALTISQWVKGKKDINVTDGKSVYVVEFWATWCGPCRSSIPHLTEMQKKFPDVVFVGVSAEEAKEVEPFVKEMGDKMDYTVALDKERATNKDYMNAYGQSGIPCAFIINKDSQVAWVGHPMQMEKPLEQIISGKYDMKAAIAADKMRAQVSEYGELATAKDPKAAETGAALLKEIGKDKDLLSEMLDASYRAEDFETFDKVLDQLATVDEDSAKQAKRIKEQVVQIKAQIKTRRILSQYEEAAAGTDADAKVKAEAEVFAALKDDASGLCSAAIQLSEGENDAIVEKLLKAAEALDADKAKEARNTIAREKAMSAYMDLVAKDGSAEEIKAAVAKIIELEKDSKDVDRLSNQALSLAMRSQGKFDPTLSLGLLDIAANVKDADPEVPVDFFRGVVYYKANDSQKGAEFVQKGLDAVKDENLKKSLVNFVNQIKPKAEEKKDSAK